ncbi:MAG: hypothetical protein KF726_05230 [Anaerolineae bacterium]|nr:hypothetical protein [Anaerolineae bacterium]
MVVALVAATSGTLLIGRAQAYQNRLQQLGLGVCDGDPCFMGMVAGETDWAASSQLTARFQTYLHGTNAIGMNLGANVDELRLVLYRRYRTAKTATEANPPADPFVSGVIDTYELTFQNLTSRMTSSSAALSEFSVNDIILLFGNPCGVAVIKQSYAFTLIYPTFEFTLVNPSGSLYANSFLQSFISKPDYKRCQSPLLLRWKGFTTIKHYLATAR